MTIDTRQLSELNNRQREAVLHTKGPLLIVAGAGAGKTKTITHRILHLIEEGVRPDKILAVTFTNKAAKEMRERVASALGAENSIMQAGGAGRLPEATAGHGEIDPRARGGNGAGRGEFSMPFISTFHSLGVHIIKENARLLGHTRYFTILDEGDTAALVKESLKELGFDPKQYDPKRIRSIISKEKGRCMNPEEYVAEGALGNVIARVWNLYEKKKKAENALDFDDLLLKAVRLLKENEEVRRQYQERWGYVHIDEYQDTNEVQYLMTKLLCEKHRNICAVGDADQNIYSWRGANLRNILSFEKDYPDAKIVMLEENYRSTQNILDAANEVIKKNKLRPERNLFTKNKLGEKIGLYEALDETDEAEFVASKILEIADGNERGERTGAKKKAAHTFADIAILYRANFQSRALEEAMLRYNIPYQVLGVKFFERKEIKDTLAYLRAARNPESLSDIKRVINFPARGIGKATLAKLFAGFKEGLPVKTRLKLDGFYALLEDIRKKAEELKPSDVIKYVVKKSGIEEELLAGGEEGMERLENIRELATLALKYDNLEQGAGIEKLLEDAALASDQDSLMHREDKQAPDAVRLMTVHASKGLEFGHVFITGLEDGLFPHARQNERELPEDREEERRLFYVALTRAREKLFLSFANFRTIFGSRSWSAPSEFIGDIPPDLLEKEGEHGRIKTIYI